MDLRTGLLPCAVSIENLCIKELHDLEMDRTSWLPAFWGEPVLRVLAHRSLGLRLLMQELRL